ncbi:hypothetical protein B0J13DRAFT_533533 [Dactylonectria estremocensis]|uniref:Uncharacterized protein n=1 Tax=Dactylonectria estremocensis TaxID=1079267 RepID=A0A9P9ICQ1_9HYPO|nr:hypothetical protein B0J13DRAFT_533533 [Dactylonectria estremocensis]
MFFSCRETIAAAAVTDNSVNDWSSDDENNTQLRNESVSKIQPGRHVHAPRPSQLRLPENTLLFVPYDDWTPDESYVEHPPTCIRYVLEWKFTFNNRSIAKQTEEDLVVAPSDFWNEELLAKIEEIAKTTSKPCKADSTIIVMSVNDRSESDITKSFKELQIKWSIVERQLQAWSHLLRIGKKLKINVSISTVSFKYVENSKTPCITGRGATAAQFLRGVGPTFFLVLRA